MQRRLAKGQNLQLNVKRRNASEAHGQFCTTSNYNVV